MAERIGEGKEGGRGEKEGKRWEVGGKGGGSRRRPQRRLR